MSYAPTPEQQAIIDALPSKEMIKANAVAGSGKTTMLNMLACSTTRSGLYLAFNKSMAEEARAKFPGSIECKTTHALAYRGMEVHRIYRDKLSRPKGGPWTNRGFFASEIAEMFDLPQVGNITPNAMAQALRRTLSRFQQSADEEIGLQHTVLPLSFIGLRAFLMDNDRGLSNMSDEERNKRLENDLKDYDARIRKILVKVAPRLWEARIDPASPVMMDHDSYLKLFQLSRPNLRQDLILLDEAQDTTDCVLDLLLRQAEQGSQLVLVGDRRQAIYGWRGAINAMAKVDCLEFPLSQSWRYGPAVADIAEAILEGDMQVRGNPALDTEIGAVEAPFTWLFRTNAGLLEAAIPMLAARQQVALEIDVKPFAKKLDSAYQLYDGHPEMIRDETIREYGTWDVLCLEAKDDPELSRIVKMVEEDADSIPYKVALLERYQRPRVAEVTLSTAHKSKGLEWSQVRLGPDFPEVYDKEGNWKGLIEDEQNLLYVAATRATGCLEINKTVRDILTQRTLREVTDTDFELEEA